MFVSRCQNLESDHNRTALASKVNDGGFFYTVAAGGSSPAGKAADGGLRSYGSMTYAGLKSMIYAGLTASDPRVKAASEWIGRHYTVAENPGLGEQGLFYYYDTFAKTMAATQGERVRGRPARQARLAQRIGRAVIHRPAGEWQLGEPQGTLDGR